MRSATFQDQCRVFFTFSVFVFYDDSVVLKYSKNCSIKKRLAGTYLDSLNSLNSWHKFNNVLEKFPKAFGPC